MKKIFGIIGLIFAITVLHLSFAKAQSITEKLKTKFKTNQNYEKQWEKTKILIKAKKYKEAAKIIAPLAKQGCAKARFELSRGGNNGEGVKRYYKKTGKWLEKAAGQSYEYARYNSGAMCENIKGAMKHYKRAFIWYKKMAERGFAKVCRKVAGKLSVINNG